jgi:hypothetical protein
MPSTELLESCGYSLQKIKRLFISTRYTDTSAIQFPIDYTTISGSSDSIIRVNGWSYTNQSCTINGLTYSWREITILNDNASFQETYVLNRQGKQYEKRLEITLPYVNYNANAAMKEMFFSSDGEFAIGKAIAWVHDQNGHYWIIGYDSPLILQDGMQLDVAPENQYKLSFQSTSVSRIRNYEILP